MVDRPAIATDKASEQQAQGAMSVASAGLNPCCVSFNNDYRAMLDRFSGNEVSSSLMSSVEAQLSKKGVTMQDVYSDPESYQSTFTEALAEAAGAMEQAEQAGRG